MKLRTKIGILALLAGVVLLVALAAPSAFSQAVEPLPTLIRPPTPIPTRTPIPTPTPVPTLIPDEACNVDEESLTIDNEEAEYLVFLNTARAKNGLRPLIVSDLLIRVAAWHVQFSGEGELPDDRPLVERFNDCGYRFTPYDADIGVPMALARRRGVPPSWMDSVQSTWSMPSSYGGIVFDERITTVGIARVYDKTDWGGNSQMFWYWVVTFGDGLAPGFDFDGDGCTDLQEIGDDRVLGGQRNGRNFWDFYDVPTGASMARDRAVSGLDLFAVLARFGQEGNPFIDPLSSPGTGYHTAFDRSLQNVYSPLGSPNGTISGIDIFLLIAQFGHLCR